MSKKQIEQKTPEDFEKITRAELHNLWFNKAYTEKKIARIYGVDRKTVRAKRKELNLGWINSAMLSVGGGEKYKKRGRKDK